jgi:hypothetical protein
MHFRVLAQRYLVASCRVNVRFGSKADMCSALGDVRFTPESGHVHRNGPCPLSAKSRHDRLVTKFNDRPEPESCSA